MSDVVQCDRCGMTASPEMTGRWSYTETGPRDPGNETEPWRSDLCPTCKAAFDAWWRASLLEGRD